MRFPRAGDPTKRVLIRGRVWNLLADAVTSISNFTVAKPLTLRRSAAGMEIGLSVRVPVLRMAVVSQAIAPGRAKGYIIPEGQSRFESPEFENQDDDFVKEDLGPVPTGDARTECRIWGPLNAMYGVDEPVWGWQLGFADPDGFPIILAAGSSPRTFPARIRKSGGTAGDDGVRATFTYDLYPIAGGDSFAQGVAVALSERKIPAEMTAAPDDSYADVLIVSPGSYLITRCDEVYVTKECETNQTNSLKSSQYDNYE